ncbi:BURP domain protein USPL1-like [Carica papaya]|uniref:BURP domain protein USPL1-like n=1 Tax=Carica papaya TaxID=3649 RepID=UPI000B8CA366|nr:BURP domain protein USPL1-like [Carica papaya]
MALKFSKKLLFGYLLLLMLHCVHGNGVVQPTKKMMRSDHSHASPDLVEVDHTEASSLGLFTISDLHIGKTITIDFPNPDPSSLPRFLPRSEADKIPFSSKNLSTILGLFSISPDSHQARRIQHTLTHCESKPMSQSETRFCATSLESMLDYVRAVFGPDTPFRPLTTKYYLTKSSDNPKQRYTITESPREVVTAGGSDAKMVGCHASVGYPYAVFYCHGRRGGNRAFRVWLRGENGDRVEALGVCHVDTSDWDPNHIVFQLLGSSPGSPVCHFLSSNALLWVPSSTSSN